MQEFKFEKNDFTYLATCLIFGQRSVVLDHFQGYKFPQLRKHKNLVVSEQTALNTENKLDTIRRLRLDDQREIETSHAEMATGIARILTYVDTTYGFRISDAMLSEDEYQQFQEKLEDNLEYKVKNVAMLLHSLLTRNIIDMPLFIDEFPNILKTLMEHNEYWDKQ